MNDGRTIFSQLISFLPDREFRRCVARYRGDSRLRGLSCWEQFLAMAFAQLTYRESLRDIEAFAKLAKSNSSVPIPSTLSNAAWAGSSLFYARRSQRPPATVPALL